jgi:hypothetical protein
MNSWCRWRCMQRPNDAAVQHVQGREQGGGAVPLVVMRHRATAPTLERQAGLGAIECLDLALFVDRQHHRVRRRIDVEANHVPHLLGEFRIGGQLELPHPVRLQTMAAPDALHRADADPDGLRHGRRGPMRGLARRTGECQVTAEWGDVVRDVDRVEQMQSR